MAQKYCERYKIDIIYESIISSLSKSGIFAANDAAIRFNYKYIYYFFVARYFRDHINEEEILQKIKEMSKQLSHEETANIMIFLAYLSRDPVIFNTMLEAASQLFQDYSECQLSDDIEFLNNLSTYNEVWKLQNTNPMENRRRMLEARDEVETQIEEDELEPREETNTVELDVDEKEINQFMTLNAASKTIQIMGQMLRNFGGSTIGDMKYELAKSCNSLGLRILSYFLDLVNQHKETIVEGLAKHISEKHKEKDINEITKEVRGFLFGLMEQVMFGTIKHISNSVGLEELSLTFADIREKNKHSPAYQIIDLSIKLDHYHNFPQKEAFEVFGWQQKRKNLAALFLIRHLVWYHFYLYPSKYDIRQSVCSKLGIQITPRLMLDDGRKRTKPGQNRKAKGRK